MRRRALVAPTIATVLAIWRRPAASIRFIRWLDQRSGIDGPSGARVYDALLTARRRAGGEHPQTIALTFEELDPSRTGSLVR